MSILKLLKSFQEDWLWSVAFSYFKMFSNFYLQMNLYIIDKKFLYTLLIFSINLCNMCVSFILDTITLVCHIKSLQLQM